MQSSRTVVAVNKNRRILAEVRALAGQMKVTEQPNYPSSLLAATRARFRANAAKYVIEINRSIKQTAQT